MTQPETSERKTEGAVLLERMVRVQWIKECAQCGSVLAIALACTGLWQPALGMVFWAWVTYYDARMKTTESNNGGSLKRVVRPHGFIAPRGYAEPDGQYRSRFNFVWWFWLPRIHTQRPDAQNPRVIRIIWLCFAAGLDIWGDESRKVWPNEKGQP